MSRTLELYIYNGYALA